MRLAGGDPVVQEAVDGQLLALVLLLTPDGSVRAAVQQRASRLYPSDAGVSARATTEPVDEALVEAATELLHQLGWWGVVELQFLAPVEGAPVLIDLNGRFYGSMALALAAGVNLPDLWARIARGERPGAVRARAGVRYQWLEGDLRRALQERRGGLARDLAATLAAGARSHHSVWQPTDQLPFLQHAGRLAAGMANKARPSR